MLLTNGSNGGLGIPHLRDGAEAAAPLAGQFCSVVWASFFQALPRARLTPGWLEIEASWEASGVV